MTQIAINRQVEVIRNATKKALKSPESALKFLIDAGIVKEEGSGIPKPPTKKKK